MEEAVKAAVESLHEEIREVLQSDLAQAFVARLDINQKVSAQKVESGYRDTNSSFGDSQKVFTRKVKPGVDVERLRSQVESLADIGETVGGGLTDLATKTGANTSGQAFLRASNVAGSRLHQGVYAAGKFIGFNFKPYQAVNIAKNIGNLAKFLGPILAVGLLAWDIHAVAQEEEQAKKLAEARCEIASQFKAIAKELEHQIEVQLGKIEAKLYGEIEEQIAVARCKEEDAISTSNKSSELW